MADSVLVSLGLFGGLILRPLCSGLAHLFYCMSHKAFVVWWSIDYISIMVCILFGSLVSGRCEITERFVSNETLGSRFTFYCQDSWNQQTFFYISCAGEPRRVAHSVTFSLLTGLFLSTLISVLFVVNCPCCAMLFMCLQASGEIRTASFVLFVAFAHGSHPC
jgi:hypothetical protein